MVKYTKHGKRFYENCLLTNGPEGDIIKWGAAHPYCHIAQFWENPGTKVCANCELTNCWGWGKIKNLLNLAGIEQLKN